MIQSLLAFSAASTGVQKEGRAMRKRLSERYKDTGGGLLGYFAAPPVLNILVQIRVALLLFAAISGGAPAALCDSINRWKDGEGNWSDAAKWSAGTVPTSANDVVIKSGSVNLDSAASARSITLGSSSALNSTTLNADWQTCMVVGDCVVKIARALNLNRNGYLQIGHGWTVNAFTLNNAGEVYLSGGTLNLQTPIIEFTGELTFGTPYFSYGVNLVDMQGHILGSALANVTRIGSGADLFFGDNRTHTITPLGGTLTNYGTLANYGATTLNIVGKLKNFGQAIFGGTVNVQGLIKDVPASSRFVITGQFNRVDGTNNVLAGGLSDVSTIEGDVLFYNHAPNVIAGGLTLSSSGSLHVITDDVNDATSLRIAGDLDNAGKIELGGFRAATISADGRVKNEKLGSITLAANGMLVAHSGYIQESGGTLVESISGYVDFLEQDYGLYGTIDAHGLVSLDGTLDVQLENGFLPTDGEKFYILSFDSGELSGRFANITGDVFNNGTQRWDISYLDQCFPNAEGGCVYLEAEANVTPEPASILLVILGAATILSAYKSATNGACRK